VAYCLAGRSIALMNLGRVSEAAGDARRSLASARELGDPAGEACALAVLGLAAVYADDPGRAVQLAGQAGQVAGDIPGWVARMCSYFLTVALTEAGDLAAARQACMAGLAAARTAGEQGLLTELLIQMATLDLRAGRAGDATAHLREALQIAIRPGSSPSVENALDCCGYLCAATGRYLEAVTAWAAVDAFLRHEGVAGPPGDARRRQEPLRRARQALGAAWTRAAEERGAAMSLGTAAEYALMLTSPALPAGAAPGTARLSVRERELVTLVAQGRTDAQIAAQLYISIRTVRSHLDRIRDKTGCRRRADLTRLALAEGLV
jgi:DNA-binding CsgD family transcriptional regulator